MGRLPCPSFSLFERSCDFGYQTLDRDQLTYCDLARDHQQRAYEIGRERYPLTVTKIEGGNSAFTNALLRLPVFKVDD